MKRKLTLFKPIPAWLLVMFAALLCSTTLPAQDVASVPPPAKKSTVPKSQEKLKAVPLQDLMLKLQKNYGIYFSYQADALKETMVVYSEGEEKQKTDAGTLLKKVLNPAGLTFEKVNNVYIIKQAAVTNTVYAPETTITAPVDFAVRGTVTDANGPVTDATVTEKGTSNVTTTNNSGSFTLNVAGPNSVIVISHIGYKNTEIPVEGRSQLSVTMESTAREMENVVVTALGITRNKKTLGYSVGEVKAEDLVKASNINLMKSLDGKVSGVNFTNVSSDPTSSVLVNIRGTTALPTTGDRNVALKGQPLYVIDGIPVGTQTVTNKDNVDFGNILSQLNPEDIDNITILKGGSAGALYGKEGGNGVVMITTKNGRGGRKGIGVTYNVSGVWDKAYQFMPVQFEFGPGTRADSWAIDGTDTWGPKLDGTTTTDYWNVKTQQWETKAMYSSNQNPVESYLQTGNTVTNNIGVQGNYDKGSFRLSLSNLDNKGVMPNTKTDQKSITLNTEYRLTNKIRVSATASYIHTYAPNKARTSGGGDDNVLNTLLYAWPTSLQPLSEMKNYWLTGFEGIRQNGAIMNDNRPDPVDQAGVGLTNPYWWAYENVHRFSRDNFFGKIQLDWQLSRNFSFLVRTGMENVKEYYEQRMSWSDADNLGKFVTGNNNSSLINNDAILTYNNNFGKFSVGISGGANYAYSTSNSLEMIAGRLSAPKLFTLTNALPGTLAPNPDATGWGTGQTYSVYGTATVGYDNQLFLDLTGRNDWNGVLPEQKISYFYPSASLSWVASETFKLPSAVNLLKFRVAHADVGNGLLRRRSIDTYSFDASDWGSAKTVGINKNLVDKDIKPMHSVTTEGGVDLGMFDNRLRLDFTYFVKKQKDQIDFIPTVPGTGYDGILTNIGDVRNRGFEIGLGLTPVKTKDFNWDISASFTKYKAVITKLSDKFAPNGYVFADYGRNEKVKIAVGEVIGSMYETEPILKVKSGKYAGMYLLDGSGGEFQSSGDERDRNKLGNFNPDFILGINTTFRYKQFALNIVGSLRYGGEYISVNQKYMESDGMTYTTLGSGPNNPWWSGGRDADHGGHPWPTAGSSDFDAINSNNDNQRLDDLQDASYAKGVFINPDFTGDTPSDADYIVNGADPNNTFYQVPTNSYGDVIWNFSSSRIYDATNFKLREISLAYTIPANLISRYKITNVTVSLIGRNMFQWNKSGRHEDPESAFQGVGTDQGVLRATLPSIRSYGIKLSVGF